MPGGSENRVTQLANSFSRRMTTYIFAEKEFSNKLKPQLEPNVILREQTVNTKKYIYELQGIDILLVVNSDSYSFCKPSYWDGTQGKHHKRFIDLSQIPVITFLFNYVVGPGQWLVDLHKVNPNIRLLCTAQWFVDNINSEKKFEDLRKLKLPLDSINSPISSSYDCSKTKSDKIRINRHSMAFAYKHDQDNLWIVSELCERYPNKISFKWMGVPSHVRDTSSDNKNDKVPYRDVLAKHKQMKIVREYTMPVPQLMQETDILFFDISRYRKEPWPRTIAEGMMGGCCCVTNDAYGMSEQIQHGKTGFLFKTKEEAIKQLSDLIDNPDKIREIGENARSHARKHFLDDRVTEKMLGFIKG